MVERKGGLGGFGAIASDSTDQRTSAYSPHSVVKTHDLLNDLVNVKCVKCKLEWSHPRGDPWVDVPERCSRETGESA